MIAPSPTTGPEPMPPANAWPHRLAVTTAATTLALILLGGLVTNTGSALAVPDWPTTFGYNMFTYPPSQWVGGVLYEHSHRLLGSLVGFLTVCFALATWKWESRPVVRRLALVALLGVICQGILGGMRVVLLQHGLAIVHGCVAQAFFGLMVGLSVATSPSWHSLAARPLRPASNGMRRLSRVVPLLVYLQIVFGALLTHTGTQLLVHATGAVVVTFAVTSLASLVVRHFGDRPEVRRPALLLVGIVALQLGLGLWAFLWHHSSLGQHVPFGVGLGILATHRVTGTILWACALLLCLRLVRGMQAEAAAGRAVREDLAAGERALA